MLSEGRQSPFLRSTAGVGGDYLQAGSAGTQGLQGWSQRNHSGAEEGQQTLENDVKSWRPETRHSMSPRGPLDTVEFPLHIPSLSRMQTGHGHFSSAANLGISDKLILNSSKVLLLLKTWISSKGVTGVGEDSLRLRKGRLRVCCRPPHPGPPSCCHPPGWARRPGEACPLTEQGDVCTSLPKPPSTWHHPSTSSTGMNGKLQQWGQWTGAWQGRRWWGSCRYKSSRFSCITPVCVLGAPYLL